MDQRQFTYVRQRVDFGFDISQEFSFNLPAARVVDVKRLVSSPHCFATKRRFQAGIFSFAVGRASRRLHQDAKD